MIEVGIVTPKVTDIVKGEADTPQPKQETILSKNSRVVSRKALAFQLFSQGKGPSSPEVRTLGVHKSDSIQIL